MALSHVWNEKLKNVNISMDSTEMLVLSLGTGEAKKEERYSAAKASEWGLFSWVYDNGRTPLIDIFSDASSDVVDIHVCTLFESFGSKGNYLRIQVSC